jgi:uncharacterized protein
MTRFLRTFAILAAAAVAATAADFTALKPLGYVSDFAGVVSPSTRQSLERYCAQVEQATGAQIALVTVPALDGEPVEDVANLLYRQWGVGQKKSNEGVLLLLSIRDRRSRVEVGYGLEPVIPDGVGGTVLRNMRPALRSGDYGLALTEAAQTLGDRIAASKNVKITETLPVRRHRAPDEGFPALTLLAPALVLFLLILSKRGGSNRRHYRTGGGADILTGILLGQILGGGRGHGSGGGFGGYDSGDSFGGFGGGDSGGGGASSDW